MELNQWSKSFPVARESALCNGDDKDKDRFVIYLSCS